MKPETEFSELQMSAADRAHLAAWFANPQATLKELRADAGISVLQQKAARRSEMMLYIRRLLRPLYAHFAAHPGKSGKAVFEEEAQTNPTPEVSPETGLIPSGDGAVEIVEVAETEKQKNVVGYGAAKIKTRDDVILEMQRTVDSYDMLAQRFLEEGNTLGYGSSLKQRGDMLAQMAKAFGANRERAGDQKHYPVFVGPQRSESLKEFCEMHGWEQPGTKGE